MNRIGRRILSQVLAFTLAIGLPFQGTAAFAAGTDAAVEIAAEDNSTTSTPPTKPTLPAGFSEALEENDGLTLADGAATQALSGCGTVFPVINHWNDKNKFHASIKDVTPFKSSAFTLLLDVKQNPPSSDTSVSDTRVASTIGSSANYLRLLTYSGKFVYGNKNKLNELNLSGVKKDDWNAVAMTYEEANGGNGHVIIYINGQKAGEVADIGFKLSSMTSLSAMIARSFDTSYLQEGVYDNIVVGNTALNEATAIAETAYRKYAKEHLPANTAALEGYITQAQKLVGTTYASAGLADAIKAAQDLLATNPDTPRQAEVDAAARKLLSEINKSNPSPILIKGSDIDTAAANINGLTYKGFGMLNGNSTSNLLLEYKDKAPEKYNEMMQYLFGGNYPLFTHIKMEMGNDGNNSTGAEACTMRYEDEEADASRSPGFVMAADAKKINPAVKISILRWEMPKWVADKWNGSNKQTDGYEAVYKWYKETIFDAYEKYGYVVDFVNPDKNETSNPDDAFIKWYSNRVKNETEFPKYMDQAAQTAYKKIRIIASDENKSLNIVPHMREDDDLYKAVDIIGFHYRTNATDDYVTMADTDDKEVWYSEGCATFGYSELQENKTVEYGANSIGGYQSPLALMDSFITAFKSSRRTHYMFQPAIGAFYEGIQYGHKELLSARDPWSGYIHYDPALYMLEHFSKFAKTGWEDSNPDTNDIWRAIPAATSSAFAGTDNEHATAGIDGNAGYMTLAAPDKSDFSVVFVNNTQNEQAFLIKTEDMDTAAAKDLYFWVTETDKYLQNKGTIEKKTDGWVVTLPAYSVATATTLNTTPERTPDEGIHNEDRVVLDTDATGGRLDSSNDILYADNFEYAEEATPENPTSADDPSWLEKRGNEPRYMLDTHGAWIVENGKLKQELANNVAQWNGGDPSTIVGDFRWMDTDTSVKITLPDNNADTWASLTVRAQTGMNWNNSGYTLRISGSGKWELYRIGTKVAEGSVSPASDNTYSLEIKSLNDLLSIAVNGKTVTTYQDSVPILSGRVKLSSCWKQVYFDDLLIKKIAGGIPYATTMIDGQDDGVTYEGAWTISNPGGGSADNWYRTLSITEEANASFSFKINGTGFAIIGGNDGTAKLDILVDNEKIAEDVSTLASPTRGETYVLSDLQNGEHTIKVVVKSGKLSVDALHTLGERRESLDTSEQDMITGLKEALPAIKPILSTGSVTGLPETVTVITSDGEEKQKTVVWNNSADELAGIEFTSASIAGTIQDAVNVFGEPYIISIPVEMVVPAKTVYYIDTVTGFQSGDTIPETTEPYETVKELLNGKIFNRAYDQLKSDSNIWGLVDKDAGTKDCKGITTDPLATGIFGAENEIGETLSYAVTLPAGTYKIISAHTEWWNNPRTMNASISYGSNTVEAGTISLKSNGDTIINKKEFTLENEQLVTYTLTAATQKQAPVISWLAVVKTDDGEIHFHEYTNYTDNGDGTHTATCAADGDTITEDHSFENGSCTLCGAAQSSHTHTYTYKDNGDGTHTAICSEDSSHTKTEAHTFIDGICSFCKSEQPAHTHTYTYKDNGDGTHTATCKDNDDTKTEQHTYDAATNTCICGAKKPEIKPPHTHTYTYKDNGNGTHTATCKDNDDTKTEPHTYVNDTCTLCGSKKTGGSANQTVSVSKVTLNSTKLTLGVKETFKLTAKVTPANATDKKVTWKSSNTKIATVKNGKITAKRKGSAKITATAGGKSVTCKVTVKTAPRKITVTPKTKSLKKGKTFTIKVKLPKNTASNKITFTSKNKRVATVSAKGKVKGIKKGKTTITIKTFNNKKATVKVTVR